MGFVGVSGLVALISVSAPHAAAQVTTPATTTTAVATTPSTDPFAVLERARGAAVAVPPRAVAVIPERHAGRLIRFVDVLASIDPQFDADAVAAGLSSTNSIQFRAREAGVPIFVRKTDGNISTALQLRLGDQIEVTGILVQRNGRVMLIAADVRAQGDGARTTRR